VKVGSPAYSLCQEVETNNYDFLYVGDRGVSGLKRVLKGSLCNFLVHHAPCNVVIVKDKNRALHDWRSD